MLLSYGKVFGLDTERSTCVYEKQFEVMRAFGIMFENQSKIDKFE